MVWRSYLCKGLGYISVISSWNKQLMKFLNPTPFVVCDRTTANLEEEARLRQTDCKVTSGYQSLLRTVKDLDHLFANDMSVGFILMIVMPVGASCILHSYVVSPLLGHVQFRENSQHVRRAGPLLSVSLSSIQSTQTSEPSKE